MRKFTLEVLKRYGWQNGNKVCIAYNGKVYDVTDSQVFKTGDHFAHMAGMDLTEELPDAPHEEEVVEGLEKVRELT